MVGLKAANIVMVIVKLVDNVRAARWVSSWGRHHYRVCLAVNGFPVRSDGSHLLLSNIAIANDHDIDKVDHRNAKRNKDDPPFVNVKDLSVSAVIR